MKSEAINLRLSEEQKAAIDYAAKELGLSRTEYMVQCAMERAADLRYDKVRFELPKQDFDYLLNQIEHTESEVEKVKKLAGIRLP